jgi:hypothetical protein
MAFIDWIENSALGIWMIDSLWAYPIILSTHAVGMSIVVGTIVMLDLRLLGYAKTAPISSFKSMFVVTWLGVTLNLLSGIALFCSDPAQFLFHPVFLTKIALMISGVVSFYFLWRELGKYYVAAGVEIESSGKIKLLAHLTLIIWFTVIVSGRLIAYVELA